MGFGRKRSSTTQQQAPAAPYTPTMADPTVLMSGLSGIFRKAQPALNPNFQTGGGYKPGKRTLIGGAAL